MVCFFNNIPFYHLEAGLRSFDLQNPFPEEHNRKVVAQGAEVHLCPTEQAKQNLLNENVNKNSIYVVGNTVIDALQIINHTNAFKNYV